jgi:UDP-2-acetamido-2,6-beta-L-arabino-hexul-4-ose reductase
LVTGAKGFLGKNLITQLQNRKCGTIFTYDLDSDPVKLEEYLEQCDFVYHLAGVNRPQKEEEFMEGNCGFTAMLLQSLTKMHKKIPVLMTSSIQAERNNPYGSSKRAAEEKLFAYERETGGKALVYRLPNVFGKWSRPNYNSAIATFCYNIARDLPIVVNDPSTILSLVYIDDVVDEMILALEGKEHRRDGYCYVDTVYSATLGKTVALLYSFKESRSKLALPYVKDELERKLYSTYVSFLPEDQFCYSLNMNRDERGSFTELFRTAECGQLSVNITKPGITKGNHWHHSKCEKFIVVQGKAVIELRRIDCEEILRYHVTGDKIEVIDIPVGYTHSIQNIGDGDLVTVMWANEGYQPEQPDTYYEPVRR